MKSEKLAVHYTNFLGQQVVDHRTFSNEEAANKRLVEVKQKMALNGKAEVKPKT